MAEKILMVAMGLDIGGAETHVVELTKELHRLGYNVHVASNGGVYAEELATVGIPHYEIPLNSRNPLVMVRAYRLLNRLLKEEKFDIVHGHARIPSFLCGLLHKKYGFRFVTTAHLDFKVTPLLRRMSNWGERTIAVSEDIRDYLYREYGVAKEKVTLTVNGVDMTRFSPEVDCTPLFEEFQLKPERRRIVYISRIDEDRSAPAFHLAELAPDIRREFPDTDIIIVGGGNDFQRLKALVDDINKDFDPQLPPLLLTGPRQDIALFTALADVFCGVSRSALEAMSACRPVIVSGNQGHLGIFNGQCLEIAQATNFCCRGCPLPDKERLWADIREELSLNKEELAAQGRYNQEIIETFYSVNRMARDYLAVYEQLPPCTIFRHGDVVVSGYYGFGNSGDDTILEAIVTGLRAENPHIRMTALTRSPREMAAVYGVRCVDRYHPFAVAKALRRSNVLIFGGGTLLQDRTSTKSLRYYTSVLRLAHWTKTPIYVYANGIGPLKNADNRKRVARELQFAKAITVREPDSRRELTGLGIAAEAIRITADPVFLLKDRDNDAIFCRFLSPGKKYFAVSLRRCKWLAATDVGFEAEIIAAICRIRAEFNLIPVFLPMQAREDDEICRHICRAVGGETVYAPGLTTYESIALISCMEIVLGMRLHSLIFAVKETVPMIGLAYDPKINGFMGYMGLKRVFEPESVVAADLVEAVTDIEAHRETECVFLKEMSSKMEKLAKDEIAAIAAIAAIDGEKR